MIYIYIYSPYKYICIYITGDIFHIWYSSLADISWAKSHPCHVIFQPEAICSQAMDGVQAALFMTRWTFTSY